MILEGGINMSVINWNELIIHCEDCGREMSIGDEYVVDFDRSVCEDCIGKYSWCDACDAFFSDDELAEEHLCYYCKDKQSKFKKMI